MVHSKNVVWLIMMSELLWVFQPLWMMPLSYGPSIIQIGADFLFAVFD
jgi:hypothetical protein